MTSIELTIARSRRPAEAARLRVGVCFDIPERRWVGMNLIGEMILAELRDAHSLGIDGAAIRPRPRRAFSRVGPRSRWFADADRFLGRFRDYPRIVRALRADFDVFHVIDHRYAHLVEEIPPGRAVVTCHDLDRFAPAMNPEPSARGRLLAALAQRGLAGLRAAARVVCVSDAVRGEIVERGLVPAERITVVPNGVHAAMTPEPDPSADNELSRLIGHPAGEVTELLHVGSTIARKRIDVLLHVLAVFRRGTREVRLLRVGGELEPEQLRLARELGVEDAIVTLPFLAPPVLAAAYRRAWLVLQPSDVEGFGLPIVEALACGTPVVASDLPALREVAEDAVAFCPRGDVRAWVAAVRRLITVRESEPDRWEARRRRGMARAANFSWNAHAAAMAEIYRAVATS